jgi:beta-lactamase class D
MNLKIAASLSSLLLLAPLCASAGTPAGTAEPDLQRHFTTAGVKGTFVLLDAQTGRTLRSDPERARARFLPASTFKIPNTLIALETGVASGPGFALSWNSKVAPREAWWPESWARDHTLETALPASVVWFYQEIARRIGPDRMRSWLKRFDYGNQDISGGIDQFWLSGGLRISPDEQVGFLHRFYSGKLPVSERSTRIVKDLLVLEETPAWRLSGKTGWAGNVRPQIGWLVGYLERGKDVYFFATNIEIKKDEDRNARLAITKAILRDLGLMEAAQP